MKTAHKYIFIVAIALFLLCAYFSKGFHHFDEHFQILEFASLKTGIANETDMPWEYREQIRPTLQPTIAAGLIKTMSIISINSPFTQAMILRMLAGMFSLFCIYYLVQTLLPVIKKEYQTLFVFFSVFLYIIPYIAVRFSSETFSACFFILGLSLVIRKYKKVRIKCSTNMLIGLLLGLSFVLRYQAAFLLVGLLLWLLIIKRTKLKYLFQIMLGCIVAILIGIAIDFWFYGDFVLSAWNYFDINILQDRAAQWGVHPLHHYYTMFIGNGFVSILNYSILLLFIFFIATNFKSPVLWSVIPFIIGHSLVGHKELRFIYPIMFFLPFIIIAGIQGLMKIFRDNFVIKSLAIIISIPLICINIAYLFSNTVKVADGQALVYEYVYNNYNEQKNLYFLPEKYDFYMMQGSLKINFYNPYHLNVKKLDSKQINNLNNEFVVARNSVDIHNLPFKKVYSATPKWIEKINVKDWMEIKNAKWVIYLIYNN